MNINQQISNIKSEIMDKADLIAVSKTRTIQEIQEAYNSGQIKPYTFGCSKFVQLVVALPVFKSGNPSDRSSSSRSPITSKSARTEL